MAMDIYFSRRFSPFKAYMRPKKKQEGVFSILFGIVSFSLVPATPQEALGLTQKENE